MSCYDFSHPEFLRTLMSPQVAAFAYSCREKGDIGKSDPTEAFPATFGPLARASGGPPRLSSSPPRSQ